MLAMRSDVRSMRRKYFSASLASRILLASGLALAAPAAAMAQTAPSLAAGDVTYPLIANLTLNADVVLTATISAIDRQSAKEAPDVQPGYNRFVIRAAVTGVLLAPRAVPGEIVYVWDAPEATFGKRPKLKGEPVLLFLRAVPGNDRIYQLVAQNAQMLKPGQAVDLVRKVAADPIRGSGFGYRVTGVADATRMQRRADEDFATHFLVETAEKGMLTVSVPETAGGGGTIQVELPDSLGETQPLQQQSLLGYFLACGLPESLPESVLETAAAMGDADAVRADYKRLRASVGPCQ